jgi:simple sugar transport system ATP-binding protein
MAHALLELRHIKKSFAAVRALHDVSMTIQRGEIHCLAGENGSGKSTLIKLISGVYTPDEGEILFDGERVLELNPQESVRRGVQVIYQDFSLFENLTVAENLALNTLLAERRRTISWPETRRLAREALDRLGIDIDLNAEIGNLPTSKKQLVAIARALSAEARLIVMDEPTTSLTGREVSALFDIVRDIQRKGVAVIFVSHKIGEVLEISERITVIRNGRKITESAMSDCTESSIVRDMTGRDIETERYNPVLHSDSTPRLEVRDLTLSGALENATLTLQPSEIVGLAGLLGSGRTDLARVLFGLEQDYSGSIVIDGAETRFDNVPQAISAGIAYVPEDRLSEGLFLSQSIKRNIIVTVLDGLSDFIFLNRARVDKVTEETIRNMQISTHSTERPVAQLSGGNQQRVMIGRWLHTDARVLILNGPTVGVDVGSKAEIHRKVRYIAENHGLSVLMISDDVPELVQNCNRILIMHRGQIVDEIAGGSATDDLVNAKLRSLR